MDTTQVPDQEITTVFVDQIPAEREAETLYVSLRFRTSLHLCACGCGSEVWLPIRPDRHHLAWDGETITLKPSIGNWNFPCRSHYWIQDGRIQWALDDVTWAESDEEARRPWCERVLARIRHPFRTARSHRQTPRAR